MTRLITILLFLSFTSHAQIICGEAGVVSQHTVTNGHAPDVAGYVAYYDATVASSVHIGTGVSQWDDLSGNSHNLTQPFAVLQPVYSGTGTTSVITFNGTSQYMKTSSFTLNQPVTVIAVMKQITWVASQYFFDGNGDSNMDLQDFGSTPNILLFAGGVGAQNNTFTVNTMKVVCFVLNGASSSISINDGTKGTGNSGASNPGGITVAAENGGATNYGHEAIQWFVVYPNALSNANQTTVISGIKTYFGI